MAVDKRLVLTYAFTNALFIACGAVTIAISIIWRNDAVKAPTSGSVEQNIIFLMTPTMLGIGAGVITLVAGLSSLPAMVMPTSRGWLRIHAWSVFIACIALLVVGLKIWTLTLQEKNNIFAAYSQTNPTTIATFQEQFNCCGFFNSTAPPFIQSPNACPDPTTASSKAGCITTLQPYADLFLNRIFTTIFGFVGIGVCAILASAMLVSARATEARYIRIAEKGGYL